MEQYTTGNQTTTDKRSSSEVVVMGVSAVGKAQVGQGISAGPGVAFIDADDLQPIANVAKMAAGTSLTGDDRWPWLDLVGEALATSSDGAVLACSALRRVYRDHLGVRARDGFRSTDRFATAARAESCGADLPLQAAIAAYLAIRAS